jgi:single-strand DNA-binding protein
MFKDRNGQPQKDTCFINVIAWAQMAEVCNQYLQKGRQVLIEGSLQSRSWKANDGQNRSTIEVRAARVQFMPRPLKEDAKQEDAKPVDLGEEPQEAGDNPGEDNAGVVKEAVENEQ